MINNHSTFSFYYLKLLIGFLVCQACQPSAKDNFYPVIEDSNLKLELILSQPDIMTPIGLTIDAQDALYVLESHTHIPLEDYEGPQFDRIKKGVDTNRDGIPESWNIFADSLEDGMNIVYAGEYGLYATTKNSVLRFQDSNSDGKSDKRDLILDMHKPQNVYDHAGILGITYSEDGWLYVSRGNTGGNHWEIKGTDGSSISGYGDGGNVFRCKMDGSELEEIATGFWNPFDIKFTNEGRLLLTDNDPDSRGPNRLVEIVPGGNYGYQSLYGGSGIHPYLAWNGELAGTLPYAAPLGEAPCAYIDASLTNFGPNYQQSVLVNIWEENNIVRIPLQQKGSTIEGTPKVLVQGDSLFHPVAFAVNSKGDLYITDWVIRQYPNHGHGKIWKLSSTKKQELLNNSSKINRFESINLSNDQIKETLRTGDEFERAIMRDHLAQTDDPGFLMSLITNEYINLRLEALLVFLNRAERLDKSILSSLLKERAITLQQMALVYIGQKMRNDMADELQKTLISGHLRSELFETFLATIRHIQPAFIQAYKNKSESSSKKLPRQLPEGYIANVLTNNQIDESTKALALPYLENLNQNKNLLLDLIKIAKEEKFQLALIESLKLISDTDVAAELLGIAQNPDNSHRVRSQAISKLNFQSTNYCEEIAKLSSSGESLLSYTSNKYLCRCNPSECTTSITENPTSNEGWTKSVNDNGNPDKGRLVFESLNAQCQTCHKINGWGGTFGPDLSNIGSSKSQKLLISSILDPSLQISPEWQGWFVIDKDGQTHFGRQIDVNFGFIKLMNSNGTFDKFEEPQSFGISPKSLMPEGLHKTMTPDEFNDLIAYLVSLK